MLTSGTSLTFNSVFYSYNYLSINKHRFTILVLKFHTDDLCMESEVAGIVDERLYFSSIIKTKYQIKQEGIIITK